MSVAVALAACASRGGDQIADDGSPVWAGTLADDATDEAGEFVVNQALLRQAREELAVLSQPATGTYLETLTASSAPRPVNDPSPSTAASPAPGAQTWADIDGDKGRSYATATAAAAAATASSPAPGADAGPASAAGQPDAADPTAEGQRPGLFGRMFGWFRPSADEAAAATATAAAAGVGVGAATAGGVAAEGAIDAAAADSAASSTVGGPGGEAASAAGNTAGNTAASGTAAAATSRPGLPGPGEPGYIVSGHSSGAMRLALAATPEPAAASAASSASAASADTVSTPVTTRSTLPEREAPAIAPVVIATTSGPRTPAGNVIVTPIGPGGQAANQAGQSIQGNPAAQGNPAGRSGQAEAATMMAAARQATPPDTPSFADVPPLDRNQLERGSFATLMGAMHGMVERCEPATQMREQALKTYRATYPAVDLDRSERDSSSARLRFDEDFARSAAATLGSNRVNCDYVRSQSYGWNQLVGDLRHMNRDSARQYRPGLITEIARGAGLGNP